MIRHSQLKEDKFARPEASGGLVQLFSEWSDYSEVYAFLDALDRVCREVEASPEGREAIDHFVYVIKSLLPEFQNRVDPKSLVYLMKCTALLGRFLVDTTTPTRLFRKMQSHTARKAKGINDADRMQQLDEAVLAECAAAKRTLADSIKLANFIHPAVRNRLGSNQGEQWPTAATIRVALRRLRTAKSRMNDSAFYRPILPEPSNGLQQMLNEWSDYSEAYVLVETLVRLSNEVEDAPSAQRAHEKTAEAIRLLLPEFQYRVDPKLVLHLMAYTAALGRFQIGTSGPKRKFSESQASTGRKAKEIKDADRTQQLDEAVLAECVEQGRMAISREFATLICQEVRNRLGCNQREQWPTPATIKSSLRRLKTGQILKK